MKWFHLHPNRVLFWYDKFEEESDKNIDLRWKISRQDVIIHLLKAKLKGGITSYRGSLLDMSKVSVEDLLGLEESNLVDFDKKLER